MYKYVTILFSYILHYIWEVSSQPTVASLITDEISRCYA